MTGKNREIKVCGALLALSVLLSCSAQVQTKPMVAPLLREAPFTYTIGANRVGYDLKSSIGDFEYFENGVAGRARAGELVITLTDNSVIQELSADLGISVLEQEEIFAEAPIKHGNKVDGTADVQYFKKKLKLPTYLVSVHTAEGDEIRDLPAIANAAGVKGQFDFPTVKAASLYRKMLLSRVRSPGRVKFADLNSLSQGGGTTTEGNQDGNGYNNHVSPSTDTFWYSNTYYQGQPYGANLNNVYLNEKIWDYGTGSGVKVAVIDSGFQGSGEPKLPLQVCQDVESEYDSLNGDNDVTGLITAGGTTAWHGREVTSVIAAPVNDSKGNHGSAPGSDILLAHTDYSAYRTKLCVDQAVQWGAKVINMSIQGTTYDSQLNSSIQAAWQANCIVVACAGNWGDRTDYPSAYSNVIGVGGHDKTQAKSYFTGTSNFSNSWNVEIWAPATNIPVAVDPGGSSTAFKLASGTSFAAPTVAGICAVGVQRGKFSDYLGAVNRLQSVGNTYTCGRAVDGIWTVR